MNVLNSFVHFSLGQMNYNTDGCLGFLPPIFYYYKAINTLVPSYMWVRIDFLSCNIKVVVKFLSERGAFIFYFYLFIYLFIYLFSYNCLHCLPLPPPHPSQSYLLPPPKQINKKILERMRRKGNPSTLLVGLQTGAATMENSMEFPHKTKNGTAL